MYRNNEQHLQNILLASAGVPINVNHASVFNMNSRNSLMLNRFPRVPSFFQTPQQELQQLRFLAQQQQQQQQKNSPVILDQRSTATILSTQQAKQKSSIISVKVLTHKLHEIAYQYPPEYAAAYMKLPLAYKFILANTIVFKFEERAKENGETRDVSTEAFFYLEKLKRVSTDVVKEYEALIGLKCTCCNNSKEYLPGCTSFVEVDRDICKIMTEHAIQSRHQHLLTCPFVNAQQKYMLQNFKETEEDKQNITLFIEQWLAIAKEFHFSVVPTIARQNTEWKNETRRLLDELEVTEDTIYDDLVSSLTSCKDIDQPVLFNDLSESMNEITTPSFEIFLQNFQILAVGRSKIELQCCPSKEMKSSNQNKITGTFSLNRILDDNFDDDEFCKDIWGFVIKSETPFSVKWQFQKPSSPPLKNIKSFLKEWKSRLEEKLKLRKVSITPKPDFDKFLPVPLEKLKSYGSSPIYVIEDASVDCHIDKEDNKNVIMGDRFRNIEGNRRFRQVVSEYRGLYLRLPSNKQEVIAETIVSLIKKQGGKFYTTDMVPFDTKKCVSYTTYALRNGFPEILRPAMDEETTSRVLGLECPPSIGILHGYVQWKKFSESNARVTITDPATGETKYDSRRDNTIAITAAAGTTESKETQSPTSEATENVDNLPVLGFSAFGAAKKRKREREVIVIEES